MSLDIFDFEKIMYLLPLCLSNGFLLPLSCWRLFVDLYHKAYLHFLKDANPVDCTTILFLT